MEVLIGVVVVASLALVAFWKQQETRATREALAASQQTVSEVVESYKDLADKIQKPWGETPPLGDSVLDAIATLDEEWLNAPESLVQFDDDLRALEDEEL